MSKQKWYNALMWGGVVGIIASTILIIVFASTNVLAGVYLASLIGYSFSSALFVISFSMNKYSNYVADKDVTRITSNITTLAPQELNGGILIYNQDENIIYISPWLLERGFTQYLSSKISALKLDLTKVDKLQKINVGGHVYRVKFFINDKTLFITDITEVENLQKYIDYKTKAVIAINEKYSSVAESDEVKKVRVDLIVREYLQTYINEKEGIFIPNYPQDGSHLAIVDWRLVKDDMDKNDNMLDVLTKKLGDLKRFISISIGIAYQIPSLSKLKEKARAAVTIAENRGGNQLVMVGEDGKLNVIGKSSEGVEIVNRVEIGLYYESFIAQLRKAKNIIVSAHVFADLDAIGSALAMAWFIKKEINNNVVIVQDTVDTSVGQVMKQLPLEFKEYFISKKDVEKLISKNTALVITDVASPKRTQVGEEIFNEISLNNKFIVDHHRMGEETIKMAQQNIYIDTTASSASGIVVDLLRFHYNAANINNFEFQSTLLLSGILLDTDKLNRGTSSRAFDAISWLFKNGANRETAIKFNQSKFEDMQKLIAFTFENAKPITDSVLFIELPSKYKIDSGKISIIANELLNYKDVEATFVVAKEPTAKGWKISARSKSTVNVQLIMEKLGGGGHFSAAAAILQEEKYPTANDIFERLQKEFNVVTTTIKKPKRKINKIIKVKKQK